MNDEVFIYALFERAVSCCLKLLKVQIGKAKLNDYADESRHLNFIHSQHRSSAW